jgi:hypothetical protein
MPEPLRLGDEAPWGMPRCNFGLKHPVCDKPATRHFMWLLDQSTSGACDEHAAYIHSRDTSQTPFDEHAHGPNCGMPGTMWRFPDKAGEEGYCFFPALDDVSILVEEEVHESQGAYR